MKYVPPSAQVTAFNCPHCGALAKQNWFAVYAKPMSKDIAPHGDPQWQKIIQQLRPAFHEGSDLVVDISVSNMWISRCFNCNDISLWVSGRLFYPQCGKAPPVNPDTPENIRWDYEEASSIHDLSPRGAAALIRLAIQKLCKELGEPGKNINDDIGALVRDGIDPRVQQALDVVRVIGNEAVHPGQIDLRDDRATAETLFNLFNYIVDKTISEPKHIAELYRALPPEKLKAINQRDNKDKQ